ncbi:nucleotidyltransferase family protein [Dyadobacter luticola]|uniref:Nucleotidyltransferase family protein n=1 Tax=Dyadobacter luticola TaxID=1979387 RepID=A0A5R9KVI6_9BACT|nr:nucleotidyltransferase family protein [Dyadobacter luticola]TLV00283.1 nucleotidyltransferase family protein [Dyadobacter luticola]
MEELAKKAADFFKDKPVKKAYVFGSTARGEQNLSSDIDILVDLDYENGADFFTFLDMRDQLSELLQTPVDLVSSNGLSPHIKPHIDQEKKLIYEKS